MSAFHGLDCFGLRVDMACQRPLPARGFHGSWLRGLLGHALFRKCCIYPEAQCSSCAKQTGCAYPEVFKPALLGNSQRLPGFVLHDWRVTAGETRFSFSLVLIGRAVRYAEEWINGLADRAGELDMGGGGPGRVREVRDLASGRTVYRGGGWVRGASLEPLTSVLPGAGTLEVRLLTPLVTKHHGDLLLGALRTRIQRLVNDYGDGIIIDLDSPPWLIARASIRSVVVPRGTDNPRRVRGQKGHLVLREISLSGSRLLAAGLYLHAGGETALGFGRYGWVA